MRMIVRLSTSFVLGLCLLEIGCSRRPPVPNSLVALPKPTPDKELDFDKPMVEFLRKQGKDPDAYLGLPGHSGSSYPLKLGVTHQVRLHGKPYAVLHLRMSSFFVPGVYAERFILMNEAGAVLDLATVVWPSRLIDRIRIDLPEQPAADGFVLKVVDGEPKDYWGNFDPPIVLLHEKEGAEHLGYALGWTGDSTLGAVEIEKERFVAISVNPRK
jgi:hypothetical protein